MGFFFGGGGSGDGKYRKETLSKEKNKFMQSEAKKKNISLRKILRNCPSHFKYVIVHPKRPQNAGSIIIMSPLNGTFKQNILKGTKADITIMNDPFASFVSQTAQKSYWTLFQSLLAIQDSHSQTGHVFQNIY